MRTFRRSRARRSGDAVISVLIRAGLVPHSYLLTTRGRRTGRRLTHPATIVSGDGRQWLVAPYGVVSWVHNVRADPRLTLRRRGVERAYTAREVPPDEAGPVLKDYIRIAGATRPYFRSAVDAPVADFVAEADLHPVFEISPLDPAAGG